MPWWGENKSKKRKLEGLGGEWKKYLGGEKGAANALDSLDLKHNIMC